MITAMTTIALILALVALLAGLAALVTYARHDRFTGAVSRAAGRDDLGYADPARLAF